MPLARSISLRSDSCVCAASSWPRSSAVLLEAGDGHLQHRHQALRVQPGDHIGADTGLQRLLHRLVAGVFGKHHHRARAGRRHVARCSSVSRLGDSLSTITTSGCRRSTQSWISSAGRPRPPPGGPGASVRHE
jgi:hypothetical protein